MEESEGTDLTTLLVGGDAACQSVLEPLFDGGELPNLRSVFSDGVSGPLESQIPPWTVGAWPSLYAGKNPGKHGVFGFLYFDGYEEDVVNATRVRAPALWQLLDHYGPTSVVVPSNFEHYLSAQLYGRQFGEHTEPWNHKRFGVVAAKGEAIDASADVRGAHLFDGAQTVLATFGHPADERMDGDALDVVEDAGEVAYPDLGAREAAATNDEAVERRLSKLGYLDN